MGELIKLDRSFQFFKEDEFSAEWVVNEVTTGFLALSDFYQNDFPILNTGFVANKSPDLYKLGVISRICAGEDYIVDPMNEETNEVIRSLYTEEYNGDLMMTLEHVEGIEGQVFGPSGFPQDQEYVELFKHDISLALDMAHIFYIEGMIEYPALKWLNKHMTENQKNPPFPFSDEGVKRKFRNVPIVRVW